MTKKVRTYSDEFKAEAVKKIADNNGQIWAWGINRYGQLGNRSTASSNVPIRTYIEDIDKDNQVK